MSKSQTFPALFCICIMRPILGYLECYIFKVLTHTSPKYFVTLDNTLTCFNEYITTRRRILAGLFLVNEKDGHTRNIYIFISLI